MKKLIFSTIILIGFVFTGCATNTAIREQIRMKSKEQANVFEEIKDGGPMPGWSVLVIRAAIKTPKEDYYLFESKSSLHGKPEYPFVFNIGGQGIIWMTKGRPDTQKRIVDFERNPEGGEGVKYLLDKKIKLKPGSYKIYMGLTEENFRKEININLTEGKTSILEFIPIYQRDRVSGQTFYKGIHDFKVSFDKKALD